LTVVRHERSRRRWPSLQPLVVAAALVPLALLAWRLPHNELGANPIREVEIQTGLWTLRLLALTLAISPLRQLTGRGALIKYRRTLGLLTFSYACVHLSLWVGVDWYFQWGDMGREIAKHRYILVGMLTFVLMLPLALTSTKAMVRRLGGRRWNALHRLVYVCGVTGTIHYLWAVKKDTLFPLTYLAVFVLLLGWRLVRFAARRSRPHTSAA
jgi:sulfoxide reductase heme-binding subunit YedZ